MESPEIILYLYGHLEMGIKPEDKNEELCE